MTAGGPGPQSGSGYFSSTNGPNSSTSGRIAFQRANDSSGGAPDALIKAIRGAEAASATSIEFSAYITAPSPAFWGSQGIAARHGMVLYVTDPTGADTNLKAACGFQIRAFDRQVFVVQWLDVGQLGATAAGNYLINFTVPLTIAASGYTQVAARWNRLTGMPSIKVGTDDWMDTIPTATIACTAVEFDIVNSRGSATAGAMNAASTLAYMDSLVVSASFPEYPACNALAGDCASAHAGSGCNKSPCCETVCGVDPRCCTVEWDAACVGIAIPACGLYVHSCLNQGTPDNDCATSPTILPSLPALLAFDTSQATTDGPPQAACNSSNNDLQIHKDVWYRFRAASSVEHIISVCNGSGIGASSNFDSKIAIYDLGNDPSAFDPQQLPDRFVVCNDDCDSNAPFASEVRVSVISAGRHYLVRLGGFSGFSGSGFIAIRERFLCAADFSGNDIVDGADLSWLLNFWGPCSGCAPDLNSDGRVDGADIAILLQKWGSCA